MGPTECYRDDNIPQKALLAAKSKCLRHPSIKMLCVHVTQCENFIQSKALQGEQTLDSVCHGKSVGKSARHGKKVKRALHHTSKEMPIPTTTTSSQHHQLFHHNKNPSKSHH
jgi:hypothetical protein